jgi:hypothetical protein
MSVDILLIGLRKDDDSDLYKFHRKAGRNLLWFVVGCLLGVSVLNGIVHVAAFPLSAKSQATRYVNSKLRISSDIKLLRLAVGGGSPILVNNALCSNRCYLLGLNGCRRGNL